MLRRQQIDGEEKNETSVEDDDDDDDKISRQLVKRQYVSRC